MTIFPFPSTFCNNVHFNCVTTHFNCFVVLLLLLWILLFVWKCCQTYVAWTNATMTIGPRNLLLKFGQNEVNIWDVPDMYKYCMDKCCLDNCHHDIWNLFYLIPGTYIKSSVINSWDIADIVFVVVGGGDMHMHSHFRVTLIYSWFSFGWLCWSI